MDTAEAQLCFDTIFFQRHVHICNPAIIQQISGALDALLIFASLTAGGEQVDESVQEAPSFCTAGSLAQGLWR